MAGDQAECCSFCGKPAAQAGKLIAGPKGIGICDVCVSTCGRLIDRERAREGKGGSAASAGPAMQDGPAKYVPTPVKLVAPSALRAELSALQGAGEAALLDTGHKLSSTRVRLPRVPRTTSGSRPPPPHRATTAAPRPAMTGAVLRSEACAARDATPAMSGLCCSSTSPSESATVSVELPWA
jgi:hypothetical protein